MITFRVALAVCFAAANAQIEEEFTITAGKTKRTGFPSFGPPPSAFYSNYGNFQPPSNYNPVNYGVNPAYLPIVQGANPTLVYVPQTGQVHSGYPIQQSQQYYNYPNQQPMYNGYDQTYGAPANAGNNMYGMYGGGGPPANGGNNMYGMYGAGGSSGPVTAKGNPAGYLSDTFISSINQAQSTWTAARNFDESNDMYDYIGDLCGVLDPEIGKPNLVAPVSYNNKDIPKEFDARKAWPDCASIIEIRDQGACGSCWAISAAESMTDRICIASQGKVKTHLSTEDIVECCSTCGKGCGGGYPGMAWNFYKEVGVVTGGEYNSTQAERYCKPYAIEPCAHHSGRSTKKKCQSSEVTTPQCKKSCENGAQYTADKNYGDISYSVDKKVESIQLEILNYGPVECAYDVYEDFVNYSKGVYKYVQGRKVGGHAVKMMGWGTEDGVDYWLCANSWGYDWAELGGFFKIQRGTNECNIESNIVAGKPRLKGNNPSPAPGPPSPGPQPSPIPPPQAGLDTLLNVPAQLVNNRLNNVPKVIYV